MVERVPDAGEANLSHRTAYTAGAMLLMSTSLVLTRTARDALYFQGGGLLDLPRAYVGIAVLSIPMALGVIGLMRAIGPRLLRIVAPLALALVLSGFYSVVRPGGGLLMTAFFMIVPLAFGVLFSLQWLLAADLFDRVPEESRAKPYGVIGGATISGGIIGGILARALSEFVAPADLILFGAAFIVASATVTLLAQRRFPLHMQPSPVSQDTPRRRLREIILEPYMLGLLAIAVMGAVTGIIVEFQFYFAAATAGNDAKESAALFADLYTVLNIAALVVQVLIVPKLQRRIGVRGSLLILPAALVGGAAMLLASPSLLLRSGVRATEGGLKSSVHRSNWEQTFVPISRGTRNMVKLVIDGIGARLGEGLAAVFVLIWLSGATADQLEGRGTSGITSFMLVAALLWLILVRQLQRSTVQVTKQQSMRPIVELPVPDT